MDRMVDNRRAPPPINPQSKKQNIRPSVQSSQRERYSQMSDRLHGQFEKPASRQQPEKEKKKRSRQKKESGQLIQQQIKEEEEAEHFAEEKISYQYDEVSHIVKGKLFANNDIIEEETKGAPVKPPKEKKKKNKDEVSNLLTTPVQGESKKNELKKNESKPKGKKKPEWDDFVEEQARISEKDKKNALVVQPKKKSASMEDYMYELVGKDFYTWVCRLAVENQVDFEEDNRFTDRNELSNLDSIKQRSRRFEDNRKRLNKGFKFSFPDESKQPRQLKDIFNYYKKAIKPEDLVKLSKGEEVTENLINLYFKVLEKINFVLIQVQNFLKNDTTPGRPSETAIPTTEKVLYCNSNFIKKLREAHKKSLDNTMSKLNEQDTEFSSMIQWIVDHDNIIIPFFSDKQLGERQGPVLVTLQPSSWRADLF